MSLTFTPGAHLELPIAGGVTAKHLTFGTLNFGNPYAGGGIALPAATVNAGATTIENVIFSSASTDGQVEAIWNGTNVLAFNAATNAEYGGVDLSGADKTVQCLVVWV